MQELPRTSEVPESRYRWDGHGTAIAVSWIISLLVSFITCGLAPALGYPAWRSRKLTTEFVLLPHGRIKFTETWAESLGRSILILILFLVTCGWGMPWIIVWERRAWAERCEGPDGTRLKFDGSATEVIGLYILTVVGFLLSLGLATPWLATAWLRWLRHHTLVHQPGVDPYQLRCDAGGIAYLVQAAISVFLVLGTLGLYLPWAIAQWHRWSWSVTSDTRMPPLVVSNGPQTPAQWIVVGGAALSLLSFVTLVSVYAYSPRSGGDAVQSSDDADYDGDFMADCEACDLDCDGALTAHEARLCDGATDVVTSAPPPHGSAATAGSQHAAPTSPQAVGTFRLTEFATLGEIGMLYRHAVARGRASALRVRGSAGGWTLAVEGDLGGANQLVRVLGWNASSLQPLGDAPASLTPVMLTTTVEANIRTGPTTSQAVAGVVPAKSLVVAFLGSVEGTSGEYGRSGTWAYVSASREDAGWMAGALLEPYQGCVPDAAGLMRVAPGVPVLASSPLLLATRVRSTSGWQSVIVAVGRDASREESYVGIFPVTSRTCGLESGEVIRVPSYLSQMMFFELDRDAGPTGLALGAHPTWAPSASGHLDWKVYVSGQGDRVVWSGRVANSVLLGGSRGERLRFQQREGRGESAAYFPLVVVQRGAETRYTYAEGQLNPVATE